MNGITYYRLKSDYPGDYTKNCALNGVEVDNNFYVLEGRDVKEIASEGTDIVLTLMNGEIIKGKGMLDFVKHTEIASSVIKAEFDEINGILKLTSIDGSVQEIEGFAVNKNIDFSISTDNTLCGDGLKSIPLGVSSSAKTGQYKAVKSIVNITEGEKLPHCGNIFGDRYVTVEDISDYGYLYDYRAVREIACELKKTGWRIPTKADWDDLLNAVEPCDCDKTHEKADRNKFLGRWAGKLLKSKTMWRECDCHCDECHCGDCNDCHHHHHHDCKNDDCECEANTCFDYTDNDCFGTKECEKNHKCEKQHCEHKGLDSYGFRVTPAGYADDGCNYNYFKERASFWTATTDPNTSKAYMKRFQFNKDGVYQDVIDGHYHLSLRLVKDYNGKNYSDVEQILDMDYPTLLLPSASKGKTIWTSCNLSYANEILNPLLPNDGQGLSYTRHYFINEWNGFKWVRNEMKQGDSVTVDKAPNGKKMVEYRVVDGEFISVNEMVYNDVMDDVKPIITDVEERLTAHIEQVEERVENTEVRLDNAEERITNSEARLTNAEERITNSEARLTNAEERITNSEARLTNAEERITNSEARLTNAEERITNNEVRIVDAEGRLDAAEEHLANNDARLEKAEERIDNTEKRLESSEQRIQNVETRVENVEGRLTTAETAIINEITERKSKDEEIEGKLLNGDGTEFDSKNGILTLKSAEGTNDITVQFTFNFGEF